MEKESAEMKKIEKLELVRLLKRTDFNCSEVARILRISRQTLYNKLRVYQLNLVVKCDMKARGFSKVEGRR